MLRYQEGGKRTLPILSIERLGKASSKEQVKAAISECIAQEIHSGREQDQAVAMCHEMVRGKTGGKE